jgi:glycosyltransferase involved in cell wall biosynthesis
MSSRCPISVLIPAKNERANLAACLESCRFADEVVVVDSGSTDGTREIAAQFGAGIADFKWNGDFPKKKNWALGHVPWRHEWVFILDADERITPELATELSAIAATPAPPCEGYYVNRRFWFLDGWLRHCGYYPSWNLRFFRHGLGRYEQFSGVSDTSSGDNEVHEHVILQGKAGYLRGEMEHYAFPTIDVWVEKHNRYSNWEARLLASKPGAATAATSALDPALARKRRLKHLASHLPFRPLLRFFYHYVWRAGFLDGYRGYIFCRLMAAYEFLSLAKAEELRLTTKN